MFLEALTSVPRCDGRIGRPVDWFAVHHFVDLRLLPLNHLLSLSRLHDVATIFFIRVHVWLSRTDVLYSISVGTLQSLSYASVLS
jgi:hypothetical protein